jgi:peptidyl-prolyl cis-trans isomerase SurA
MSLPFQVFVLCFTISARLAAEVQVVERIVAKVNGDIVIKSELEAQPPDALREQIDALLLIQKGRELAVNVDSDVTRELADIQATKAKIADPDKFRAWLQEQSGMPFEDFREQLRNRQIQQRVMGIEVANRITIPKPELQQYYDEHKEDFFRQDEVFLREIVSASSTEARDILTRLRSGEAFAGKKSGAIGLFRKEDVIPELREAWGQLRKGYVTEIIKVDSGFAIFKVDDRHESGQARLEDVENEITERLFASHMEPRLREYLTRLRQEAFLEIRDGYTDSGAALGKDTAWKEPLRLEPETISKEFAAHARKRLLGVIPLRIH